MRVHVDDLAVGRFPPRCAITGRPSTDLVHFEASGRELRAGWLLLLLLGPVGVAAIVSLYLFSGPGRRAGGLIPLHDDAIATYNGRLLAGRRWARRLGLASAAAIVLLLIGAQTGQTWYPPVLGTVAAGLALAAIGSLVVSAGLARSSWLTLQLDGSRRWVLVQGVHPGFAHAVVATAREREGSRS